MSTKTTFKRVAVIAAAALTLGGFSAVSANAAWGISADSVTLGAATSTGVIGIASTNTITITGIASGSSGTNGVTATVVLLSAPATSTAAGILPSVDTTTAQVTANALAASNVTVTRTASTLVAVPGAAGRFTGVGTLSVTPDVAGTYVYQVTPSGGLATAASTWTLTVAAPVYNHSVATLAATSPATIDADGALNGVGAASLTKLGTIAVSQYSSADTANLMTTATAKDVVVAISKGLVSKTDDYTAAAASVTTAAATAATNTYYIFANGVVGTASLTVTVGGTLVSTKTVLFQGPAASIVVASAKKSVAPTATSALTLTSLDAAGNAATANPTAMTCTSSDTAVATVSGTTVTGVAAGTATITCADDAKVATSGTVSITVAPTASATLPTITFDKDSYTPGELMTITVSAAAADNATFNAFTAAPVSSSALTLVSGAWTSGNVALVGGKSVLTAYAPIGGGDLVITATSGTGSSADAATVTGKTTIVNAAQDAANAALDAAQEATDAANAAYDAANNAMDSADAATAAAQDAADNAAQALTAVTALSATVAKLVKQISAIAATLAKIQKKIGA